ncbi:MAG TPA: peptidoglycan-binding protein [Solirubrobacter sp.]|nr:peptidoglycan-binding protein [Solirubrobacter sp.]
MADRDLASVELWQRSLERSQRRRAHAAVRRRTRVTGAHVSAALLTATVVAPVAPAVGQTLLRRGSSGADVAAVQRALGIPADGEFGPVTRRAVRTFQAAHGLEVDGVVGPITSGALGLGGGGSTGGGAGATTMALQRALGVAADGVYGPVTRAAVRSFQSTHGLEVDGVAGPVTLGALGLSGPTLGLRGTGAGGAGSSALAAVRSQLGAPYRFGGTGDGGWDCSGLVQWALARAGVTVPRTSYAQYGVGVPVARSAIAAGDLVFFNTDGGGASHVGIATSNASVISATTHGVLEHPIGGPYWGAHYVGARRL